MSTDWGHNLSLGVDITQYELLLRALDLEECEPSLLAEHSQVRKFVKENRYRHYIPEALLRAMNMENEVNDYFQTTTNLGAK
jgi:hypothetical protein